MRATVFFHQMGLLESCLPWMIWASPRSSIFCSFAGSHVHLLPRTRQLLNSVEPTGLCHLDVKPIRRPAEEVPQQGDDASGVPDRQGFFYLLFIHIAYTQCFLMAPSPAC